MNEDYNRDPIERHVRLEIPEQAYDVKIGSDMITQGLLFKTNSADGSWIGHFKSFGSVGQSPVAMIAKRFVIDKTRVDIYA